MNKKGIITTEALTEVLKWLARAVLLIIGVYFVVKIAISAGA